MVASLMADGDGAVLKAADLADANGTTAAESFTSPEDALEWQESMRGMRIEIPVNERDGRTIIGVFVVEYPK